MKAVLRSLFLSLLLSGLGLAWVIYQVGSLDLHVIAQLPVASLLFALLALSVSFLFAGLRLQQLSEQFSVRLTWFQALRIHILGIFSTTVTPGGSGGTPAIALMLQQYGLNSAQAWATGIALFATDAFFHAWGMPISLVILYSLDLYPKTPLWTALGLLTLILAIAVAYLVRFKLSWLTPLFKRILRGPFLRFRKAGLRFLERMLNANAQFSHTGFAWHLRLQTFTVVSWMGFFAVFYCLAQGFNVPLSFLAAQAAQMLVTVMSIFVPTPGGSGFFEIGMSYVLIAKGGESETPAIILLWRLLTYYLMFVLGPFLGGQIILQQLGKSKE